MSDKPGGPLQWRSALEDASWPVTEILSEVLADGASPILCLNPSHGQPKPGYDYSNVTKRDIDFLRRGFRNFPHQHLRVGAVIGHDKDSRQQCRSARSFRRGASPFIAKPA